MPRVPDNAVDPAESAIPKSQLFSNKNGRIPYMFCLHIGKVNLYKQSFYPIKSEAPYLKGLGASLCLMFLIASLIANMAGSGSFLMR